MKKYLVKIRRNYSDFVTPERGVFEIRGEKRFWFFYDGKKRLAVQDEDGIWIAF